MKLPFFISNNLILKITSLNSLVVSARLVISLLVQNLLAQYTGQAGIAKVGQIRNISNILMSVSSFGVFNGVVKYISQYKKNNEGLIKLFSTVYVLSGLATLIISLLMFFTADKLSIWLFFSEDYILVIQLLAVATPFIAMNRIFNAVISGISAYKIHAKIEIIWYSLASLLLLISLYYYNIDGVLLAIAITPVVQFLVLAFIFGNTLKEYIKFSQLSFKAPMLKVLLGFTLISFVATVCSNFVEINFRNLISERISENEAGIWTAMSSISKIYMQFLITIFSIYILPKYAEINFSESFKNEVKTLYKTLLPLVIAGMLLVYFLKENLILTIYNEAFIGMTVLFKWQLSADLVRFIANILSFKFLAKNQVKYFISTQLIGLITYYICGHLLINHLLVEGLVIALLLSNLLYFVLVLFIMRYDLFGKNRPI
ncbi:MAG: O-antigen flippase [Flavobacteriaceae bacterium]|nr:O-antigen flippase [Flavobacteriaceae bacterium]